MWKIAGLLFTLLGWSHYLQAQNLPNMNRIVGGHIARIEDYPYMVHVLHNNRCSGAIINNNTVLTAAHCIFRRSIDGTVIAGETLFHKNTYPKGHLFKTVWAKMHPDYDDITKANDIAIVRIDGFFEYSDKIKPIELLDDEVPAGEFCAISGWGKTTLARPKKGPKPSVSFQAIPLRAAEVPIVSDELCNKIYARSVFAYKDTNICAGYKKGGIDTCLGDSGGPLVYKGKQIGIVSWGYGCADARYPGVYTKVRKYLAWIAETASQ